MINKNTEAIVYSLDGETDFFEIVAGFLQGDTFAAFLFIHTYRYTMYFEYQHIQ